MAIQFGTTIQGRGDFDQDAAVQEILNLKGGQSLGKWAIEEGTGPGGANRRYISTPYGKLYDLGFDSNERSRIGGAGETNTMTFGGPTGLVGFGAFANEHGSDGIVGRINDEGVVEQVGMDRQSNRDQNWMLAAIASMGAAAWAGAGAAAAPGAGTATTGTAVAAAPAAAGAGGVLGTGMSAAEIAQLGLAGASLVGAAGSGGDVSSTPGAAPVLADPSAPPTTGPTGAAMPQLATEFYRQNQIQNRNQTLLTDPSKVTNHLMASGNTLLGA